MVEHCGAPARSSDNVRFWQRQCENAAVAAQRKVGAGASWCFAVDDLSAANVLSRIAASRHLSEHASGHHARLPPPPAPSLIWTGAGRRDMGRVQ